MRQSLNIQPGQKMQVIEYGNHIVMIPVRPIKEGVWIAEGNRHRSATRKGRPGFMNVVDLSGWLEYFADGANASFFAPTIEDTEHLIVPTICVFEVLSV